jgi:predicted transcriptional regulator
MEVLWDAQPLSADAIVSEAMQRHGWGVATVKTLINRLLKKKALKSERIDGRIVYVPLITRDDYLASQSQGLLDRLFDGQVAPLVAHYARHRGLSAEELARLRQLIEELDDDN